MGTAIGITLNNGYPGTYSRNGDCIIVARPVKATDTVNISFGDAVVLNGEYPAAGGTFSDAAGFIAGGGTFSESVFAGIAVREVLTMSASYSPAPTLGAYLPGQPCDVLERGSVIVVFSNPKGTASVPVAGGPVYLRTSTNGAGTVVGAFEPAADGGHTVQLTNCFWQTGIVDANGNIEMTIVARNLP
jgi:hypothetical protein